MITDHLHVEMHIPTGVQLVQGRCETCEASFGVLVPQTDEKFPLFCPFCAHRATFVRMEVKAA